MLPGYSAVLLLLVLFTGEGLWHNGLAEEITVPGNHEVRRMDSRQVVYLRTEDDMNKLLVDRAGDEAQADIRTGNIRLFFEDRSEAPELLGNENILPFIPVYIHVSIGTGCLDEINDADCPVPYKEAYENALRYGACYNRRIAAHFLNTEGVRQQLDVSESLLPDNATRAFIGAESSWSGLVISLHDMVGPFGGREISIKGSGQVKLRLVQAHGKMAGLEETFLSGSLGRHEIFRLITVLIENDFLAITLDRPVLLPDSACPQVVLQNSSGQGHHVTGWVKSLSPGEKIDTPVKRFNQIYLELLRIERVVQMQNPARHLSERE